MKPLTLSYIDGFAKILYAYALLPTILSFLQKYELVDGDENHWFNRTNLSSFCFSNAQD